MATADIKQKYPASNADTTALTITLAALPTSSTLITGREATVVDNRTFLDIDHLVSGKITTGTSPTGGRIELWAIGILSASSGTPTYPCGATGADANLTITNSSLANKNSGLILLWSTAVDATSNIQYSIPPTSIAKAFGEMPPWWSVFVTHSSGSNLHATTGNQAINYSRIQKQTV
jgi:hypothetical protein